MSETATLPPDSDLDIDAPPSGISKLYKVVNGLFVEPTPMGALVSPDRITARNSDG